MSGRRVAAKPLDPDAVAAANAAVEPETGGRPIRSHEVELRKKWMDAYVAAGGKLVGEKPTNRKPDQPCESCKEKKISVKLIELEYVSDHDLLKDNNADWQKTGTKYTPPDWSAAGSNPISHTIGKNMEVKVVVEVTPPDAAAEAGRLLGGTSHGTVFDSGKVSFDPATGRNTFTLKSKKPLGRRVSKYNFGLKWKVTTKKSIPKWTDIGQSKNDLYTTLATPRDEGRVEDGVTVKRMDKAVELIAPIKSTDPHTIVRGLMKKFPYYTLKKDPSVPAAYNHPTYFDSTAKGLFPERDLGGAWLMAENITAYGECQAIVRFVRAVVYQIGCPGTAEAVVVWAYDDGGSAKVIEKEYFVEYSQPDAVKYRLDQPHKGEKKVGGKKWYCALADADPGPVGATFSRDTVGLNNFEACLKFAHKKVTKYYGGGAGIYKDKDHVIKAFHSLIWFSVKTGAHGRREHRVEAIVKKWR